MRIVNSRLPSELSTIPKKVMRKFPPLSATKGRPVLSTHPRLIWALPADLLLKLPRPEVSTFTLG